MSKTIKDPIYGYIEIDDMNVFVINSIYFQRLRNVIQTSYTAIYPSSLHNRFTHSLGVYWLGKMAFKSLINNTPAFKDIENLEEIEKTFVFACLCHDLGHSPFSHTGEKFYDKLSTSKKLDEIVNDAEYSKDLQKSGGIVGNEHEIMSALLSLQVFGSQLKDEYFSLFARCIIGLQYPYNKNLDKKNILCRACVEMLNSSIIDVDKLDYLIRDSYMSGYESISIDYIRLLNGVFINNGEYPIGYEKSALSVLESVLTAHDMERRWIQSHPTTLYEAYIIQTIIRELENNVQDKGSLFSLEALKEDGVNLGDKTIRLLSDSDVLHLAKQYYDESDAVKEYCDRNLRRHPFWKSEAEFALLFDFKKNELFIEILLKWEDDLLEGRYGVYSLNDTFNDSLHNQLTQSNEAYEKTVDETQKRIYQDKIEKLKIEIDLLEKIKKYLLSKNIPFDLVIISKKQFKSNIYKPAFKDLPIRFNSINSSISKMSEVTFMPLDTQEEKEFFYLFYKRQEDSIVDIEDFSKELRRIAII